jgi:hypothetical protein
VWQACESAFQFPQIVGQLLQRFDFRSEGHHGEERRAVSRQIVCKNAHRLLQSHQLFRGHAAGNIQGEDDRHGARRSISLLDIVKGNRALYPIFVEFEILRAQIPHGVSFRVCDRHINGH